MAPRMKIPSGLFPCFGSHLFVWAASGASWTSWYRGGAPTREGNSGSFLSKRDHSNSSAYFIDAASTPSLTRRSHSLPRHLSSPHGSQPPDGFGPLSVGSVSSDASIRETRYETASLLPSFLLFTSASRPSLSPTLKENERWAMSWLVEGDFQLIMMRFNFHFLGLTWNC